MGLRSLGISTYAGRSSHLPSVVAIALIAVSAAGCGSGPRAGSGGPPLEEPVSIATQPADQMVAIGRSATFTVVAHGAPPYSYQWSKDGVAIAGATGGSYTTPLITAADNESTFQVTVKNASSSATSSVATLTVGPRAPAIGDLRYLLYEQVQLPGLGNYSGIATEVGDVDVWVENAVGTPLDLGSEENCEPGLCIYPVEALYVPPGMTGYIMYYRAGDYARFQQDLQSFAGSNDVILSLDLEPAYSSYGFAVVQTVQGNGFDYRMDSVPLSEVASTVAEDGTASRIVTAVSFDDSTGLVDVISYGWQGDTSTLYESQTMQTTFANVAMAATTLANEGYFISAFGGNDTDGYLLVGMRVHGDTMPRPVDVSTQNGIIPPTHSDSAYYTTVVYLHDFANFTIVQQQ